MSSGRERLKIAIEWCGAAVLSIALLPAILALGAAVALTSRGGPLYVSPRLGKGGRVFGCLKLRTMKVGSPVIVDADARTVVAKGDPRVTWLGRALRRGFDELLQLVNVLEGDMGLVGPRPDPAWMLPRYTSSIRRRLGIRPGITGLASVLDCRGRLSAAQGYALDLWYIDNHSFRLDAWILAATILYLCGWTDVGRRRLELLRSAGVLDAGPLEPVRPTSAMAPTSATAAKAELIPPSCTGTHGS